MSENQWKTLNIVLFNGMYGLDSAWIKQRNQQNKVDFSVQKDTEGSAFGITLKSFSYNNLDFEVVDTLAYAPWSHGWNKQGTAQVGLYQLQSPNENIKQDYFARVKDLKRPDGRWRIELEDLCFDLESLFERMGNHPSYKYLIEVYKKNNTGTIH